MNKYRPPVFLIALSLLVAAFLACAPVAPSDDTRTSFGQQTVPSLPQQQQDGEPTRESTPPPAEEDPLPTPKPTPVPLPGPEDDQDPKPEPTPDPDDPPTPPRETIVPEPTPQDGYPTSEPDLPHPDGLTGCLSLNMWSASSQEYSDYSSWCWRKLGDDVRDNCRGVGSTREEKACGEARLAEVKNYAVRASSNVCLGISVREDRHACGRTTTADYWDHLDDFHEVWNEILLAVRSNAEVKVRFSATVDCVTDAGFDAPDDRPLPWQEVDPKRVEGRKLFRGATTEEQIAAEEARWRTIRQCGADTGLYAAQDAQWLAEIASIAAEEPDRLIPFKKEGLVEILEADGPAAFLSNFILTD